VAKCFKAFVIIFVYVGFDFFFPAAALAGFGALLGLGVADRPRFSAALGAGGTALGGGITLLGREDAAVFTISFFSAGFLGIVRIKYN
jgi:hypothetical protein